MHIIKIPFPSPCMYSHQREISFSQMVSPLKSKADGASRGGSLHAEMSAIYRNKTKNEKQKKKKFSFE